MRWGHAPSPPCCWGDPHPRAGAGDAYDRSDNQRNVAGLNNNANTISATAATGTPNSDRGESTVRYHATGSSNSPGNPAGPRPQRLPVSRAEPAASTAPPATANHTAVPKPLATR